jgi:hypothetical protein
MEERNDMRELRAQYSQIAAQRAADPKNWSLVAETKRIAGKIQ